MTIAPVLVMRALLWQGRARGRLSLESSKPIALLKTDSTQDAVLAIHETEFDPGPINEYAAAAAVPGRCSCAGTRTRTS